MTLEATTGRFGTRPPPGEQILVIGDGPVARAFAQALERSGAKVSRWWRRQGGPLASADLVLLAVSDPAISEVAAQVMDGLAPEATPPILLHTAGGLAADAPFATLKRRPLGVGLIHPLRALAGGGEDSDFGRTIFAVSGDEPGLDAAVRLVMRVGGRALPLAAGALASYHAAATLVSNHTVALVDAGVELCRSIGLDQAAATEALARLLESTAHNLARLGLPDALTGPISRGDWEAVARHLAALQERPELGQLYRATAARLIEVARQKGQANAADLERIYALLFPGGARV